MNTPKILPWLARKAGIGEARAEELWHDAIRYATLKTGWVGTSEYWRVAVERLIELIELERAPQPALSRMVRFQAQLGMLPLIAWEGISLVCASAWSRFFRPGGRAPRQRHA